MLQPGRLDTYAAPISHRAVTTPHSRWPHLLRCDIFVMALGPTPPIGHSGVSNAAAIRQVLPWLVKPFCRISGYAGFRPAADVELAGFDNRAVA